MGYWERYDEEIISMCKKLIVLKLNGWEESKGVCAEMAIALRLGIPIEFMEVKKMACLTCKFY